MKFKAFLSYEWDAIAGVLAAVVAIVLHLLHIVDEAVVLPILLALVGLLFINFMRHTRNNEITAEHVQQVTQSVARLAARLEPPDIVLVGPRRLRAAHERFASEMQGETLWYNVCLSMYAPPALFDLLLRPAIENPHVRAIQFVLDTGQRETWEQLVQPQVERCPGASKVREPHWRTLERNVSFILADCRSSGRCEALLSFWGEPFMAQATGHDLPRYIFHVQPHSELLTHLVELHRKG